MKPTVKSEFKNFQKGLISEASPLNFPENAFQSGVNFEISRKGIINRRFGMDFENGHEFKEITGKTVSQLTSNIPKVYKWEAAGGDVSNDILVVQAHNSFYFYNLASEPFADGFITSFDLTDFSAYTEFSMTDVDGNLVIACGADFVIGIEYKKENLPGNPFVPFATRVETRDVWGTPSEQPLVEADELYRPLDIDAAHLYNLQNQSWGIPRRDRETDLMVDPVYYYKEKLSLFPSNSEQVWTGLQFAPGGDPKEVMYPNLWDESFGSSTVTGKGYYVIDAVNRGAYRMSAFVDNKSKNPQLNISGVLLPLDKTVGGPKVVSTYSGRVFYAGFGGDVIERHTRSPSLTNHVFFSQLVRSPKDLGKCYQNGDPTSRENNDIVDTDGGFLVISEAKEIIDMKPASTSLIIFATNGVWALTGGADYGFGATNYKVDKISSFGALDSGSIVSEGDKCFYWSKDGIFVVAKDQFGSFQVQSISDPTIQTYYISLSDETKLTARSAYDGLNKQIKWLYQVGGVFVGDSYAEELILDLSIGAFFLNRVFDSNENNYRPVAIISSSMFRNSVGEELVTVIGDDVEVSGDDVITITQSRKASSTGTRYLVLSEREDGVPQFSFAFYRNTGFKDWDEVDASAHILTGDMTFGDSSVNKQMPYIVMHMQPTETSYDAVTDSFTSESGLSVRAYWGWARSPDAVRWSTPQQGYRPNRRALLLTGDYSDNFNVVSSKLRMRGAGKALSLLFETQPEKDCVILGWSTSVSGNSTV